EFMRALSALPERWAYLTQRQRESALGVKADPSRETSSSQDLTPEADFYGWEILRELSPDELAQIPTPAAGRGVIALEPLMPGLNDESEGTPPCRQREQFTALVWKNRQGQAVLHTLDVSGGLLHNCQSDATWLPGDWEMDVFPAGWALPHLEAWF